MPPDTEAGTLDVRLLRPGDQAGSGHRQSAGAGRMVTFVPRSSTTGAALRGRCSFRFPAADITMTVRALPGHFDDVPEIRRADCRALHLGDLELLR